MSEKSYPTEINIWGIPFVKHKGRVYRVINSENVKRGNDYIISGVDSDRYVNVVKEIQWDALYIRGVSNILDIEGLGSLTFLRKLELVCGTITETVGLERLVNLEELDLNSNQITSTSGLQTLVNLKKLHLNDNQITEVKGLTDLRNLKGLYLYNNQISELDASELPKSLEHLSLKGNDKIKFENFNRLWQLKELIS